ncbi:hypothetical protein ELZ40_12180 [Enterococcus faecium]|nr:hypothetical protein [Enterococcus faecium]
MKKIPLILLTKCLVFLDNSKEVRLFCSNFWGAHHLRGSECCPLLWVLKSHPSSRVDGLLFPFVYLFCNIFSHAKVHDSFYLKWKMRLINYSSEIRKAFFNNFSSNCYPL